MAKKVITTLVDDLDGTQIDEGKGETVRFSLDGTNYEIDLTTGNARALRDSFERYINAGRQVTARRGSGGSRNSKEELAAMRKWANENGFEVSDRGRVPNNVQEAYRSSK